MRHIRHTFVAIYKLSSHSPTQLAQSSRLNGLTTPVLIAQEQMCGGGVKAAAT